MDERCNDESSGDASDQKTCWLLTPVTHAVSFSSSPSPHHLPPPTQEATDPVSQSCVAAALIRFVAPSPLSPPAVSSSVHLHARLLLLLCLVPSPRPRRLIPNIPPGGAADVYLFHLSVRPRRLKKDSDLHGKRWLQLRPLSPQLRKTTQTESSASPMSGCMDGRQGCCCLVRRRSLCTFKQALDSLK